MYINHKIARFLVSFIIAILLYFVVILFLVKGDFDEVLKAMLAGLIFTFFLTIPAIGFVIYKTNHLLTPLDKRSKETTQKNKKISKLSIIVILFLLIILLFIWST